MFKRILKAVAVGLIVYFVAVFLYMAWFMSNVPPGAMGPVWMSMFASTVMSPGYYFLAPVAGAVAGLLSFWKWK